MSWHFHGHKHWRMQTDQPPSLAMEHPKKQSRFFHGKKTTIDLGCDKLPRYPLWTSSIYQNLSSLLESCLPSTSIFRTGAPTFCRLLDACSFGSEIDPPLGKLIKNQLFANCLCLSNWQLRLIKFSEIFQWYIIHFPCQSCIGEPPRSYWHRPRWLATSCNKGGLLPHTDGYAATSFAQQCFLWLVVWNIFSIYWEYSSQLTHILQRGRYTTNQFLLELAMVLTCVRV